MLIEFHMTKVGASPGMKCWKGTLNRAMKAGYKAAVHHWYTQYLRMHFGNSASRRYGYTPRKGEPGSGVPFHGRVSPNTKRFQMSYTKKKLKTHGHTRPLEWSGDLRRSTKSHRFTGAKTYGAVSFRADNLRGRIPESDIDIREELTTIRDDEMAMMLKIADKALARYVNQFRPIEKSRVT